MLARAPSPLGAVTTEEAEALRGALPHRELILTENGAHGRRGQPPFTLGDWWAVATAHPELRAELLFGRFVCMGIATPEHEALVGAVTVALGVQLRGTPCRPYGSNLAIEAGESYVNADVAIVCGPVVRHPDNPNVIRNPSLVVEVTSPRTEARDRGEKSEVYAAIPSLEAILLVSPELRFVTLYTRASTGATWALRSVRGGRLELGVANLVLDVDALYDDAGL